MFDKNFYPTPKEVIEMMNFDCFNKTVLEPSAGKGDIIDFCKENGAKSVYCYELNEDLQKIVADKGNLIGSDFLDANPEDVSHIDMIIMNPPFDRADRHIIHAFNIAPEGAEIFALCNWQSVENESRYSELSSLVKNYGVSVNFGDCFSDSERKTNVEVGFIQLYKPVVNDNIKFDGFFTEEEYVNTESGVMPYNEIQNIVNRYVDAVKSFKKINEETEKLNNLTPDDSEVKFIFGHNNTIKDVAQFCKDLQVKAWRSVFNKMKLDKYVTSGVMEDINIFCQKQSNIPFTMKNIYRMFDIIVGTRQNSLDRALEETIDHFTKHTKENRYGVEGWVTNSGYMLNRKFIINYMVEETWGNSGKLTLNYRANYKRVNDLIKVLCNLTGCNYDSQLKIRDLFNDKKGLERGVWYDMSFFEIKCFKKGTVHLRFKDENDWYILNKAYGELKGFTLPEKNG